MEGWPTKTLENDNIVCTKRQDDMKPDFKTYLDTLGSNNYCCHFFIKSENK